MYFFALLSLISLISSVISFLLANFIFYRGKKNLQNSLFILACLSLTVWGFFDFMGRQASDEAEAYFWVKHTISWPFTVAFFFHFVLIFTEKTKMATNKAIYLLIYLPAVVFFYLHGYTDLIFKGVIREYWGYSYVLNEDSWAAILSNIWLFGTVLLSFVLYLHYYIKLNEKRKKTWTMYLAASYALIITGIITERIQPWLYIKFPPSTAVFMIVMAMIIGYAIWKYELFTADISTAAGSLVSTIPDPLVLVNKEREIIAINPAFCRNFEFKDDEIIGKSLSVLFDNQTPVDVVYAELTENRQLVNNEIMLKTKTGKSIPVLFSASVIFNKKKQDTGIVCIARDISDYKQAEKELLLYNQKLQQSSQELLEFAYKASFDLLKPLRKINTFSERIKERYRGVLETEGLDYLGRIQNAVLKIQNLIDNLQTFSGITAKKSYFVAMDISQIIKDVLVELEVQIKAAAGKVEVGALPVIAVDPAQMRLLFLNLVGNALKFHKPGEPPVVKISAEINAGQYRLVVKDNGIGIDEQDYGRIFKVLNKLSDKHSHEGSGIGLAVCKKIVERHGGTIRVESIRDKGTEFIICFPVKEGYAFLRRTDEKK